MRNIKPLRLTKGQIEIQKSIPRSTVASLGFELSCSIFSSFLAGQTGMSDHYKLTVLPLFVFYLSANEQQQEESLPVQQHAPTPILLPQPCSPLYSLQLRLPKFITGGVEATALFPGSGPGSQDVRQKEPVNEIPKQCESPGRRRGRDRSWNESLRADQKKALGVRGWAEISRMLTSPKLGVGPLAQVAYLWALHRPGQGGN